MKCQRFGIFLSAMVCVPCLLLLVCGGAPASKKVVGVECPSEGDPKVTYEDSRGKRTTTTVSFKDAGDGDINGDGKDDMKISESTDENGDSIQCWCLQKSADATQQLYCLKVLADGTQEWFGGCFFPNGGGEVTVDGKPSKKKGVSKVAITKATVTDIEKKRPNKPTTQPQPQINDGHYVHNGKNRYQVKTIGKWVWDGKKWIYKSAEVKGSKEEHKHEKKPYDLVPVNNVGDLTGENSLTIPVDVILDSSDYPRSWKYVLDNTSGIDKNIMPGDQFWIAATGIFNATVNEPASLPDYGGWRVKEWDMAGVTYEATTTATLSIIEGFWLRSNDLGGWDKWYYARLDDSGYSGQAFVPARSGLLRGDVDLNGRIQITDSVRIIQYLFLAGEPFQCPNAAYVNDDSRVDLSDAISILLFMFLGNSFQSGGGSYGPPMIFILDC